MKTGRPKTLEPDALLAQEAFVNEANRRHDAKYGQNYERFGWRSGFEPASFKLDRESIWAWHRKIGPQPPIQVDVI